MYVHPDMDEAIFRILKLDRWAHIFFVAYSKGMHWKNRFLARLNSRAKEDLSFRMHHTMLLSRIHFIMDIHEDSEARMVLIQSCDTLLAPLYLNTIVTSLQVYLSISIDRGIESSIDRTIDRSINRTIECKIDR